MLEENLMSHQRKKEAIQDQLAASVVMENRNNNHMLNLQCIITITDIPNS